MARTMSFIDTDRKHAWFKASAYTIGESSIITCQSNG